jgi:hypothetical protein
MWALYAWIKTFDFDFDTISYYIVSRALTADLSGVPCQKPVIFTDHNKCVITSQLLSNSNIAKPATADKNSYIAWSNDTKLANCGMATNRWFVYNIPIWQNCLHFKSTSGRHAKQPNMKTHILIVASPIQRQTPTICIIYIRCVHVLQTN